jgi:hypothetical protein
MQSLGLDRQVIAIFFRIEAPNDLNGVLKLTLPKATAALPRKITVS